MAVYGNANSMLAGASVGPSIAPQMPPREPSLCDQANEAVTALLGCHRVLDELLHYDRQADPGAVPTQGLFDGVGHASQLAAELAGKLQTLAQRLGQT